MKTRCLFRITLTLFLLFFPLAMFAQDDDTEEFESAEKIDLHVSAQISVRTVTVGTPWTFTLYVNHAEPDEVTVITPPLAPSLFLDRVYRIRGMIDTDIQTVIEYRFIPNSPGRFFIEPFTVITPHGIAETERQFFDVAGLSVEQRRLSRRMVWEGSPRQMAAGERAVISLRITDRDSNSNAGRMPALSMLPDFFMPEIPRGAIIVSSPLSAEERERGFVLKLALITLEAGNFILPARQLQYENTVFEIPAVNIRVTSFEGRAPAQNSRQNAGQDAEQDNFLNGEISGADVIQFPVFHLDTSDKNISQSRLNQCESIYNKAKDLWDSGLRAQALAELRRNERYHPAGNLLRPIRQEAEKNLEFFNTQNESRELQKVLLILAFSFFIFVIISLFVCFFLKRGPFVKKAALVCTVIFAAIGAFCFFRFADSNTLFYKNRFGVTKATPVRLTADYEGEELFCFSEGRPVVIMLNSGAWVYVRANDAEGKSGWLPSGEVIFY